MIVYSSSNIQVDYDDCKNYDDRSTATVLIQDLRSAEYSFVADANHKSRSMHENTVSYQSRKPPDPGKVPDFEKRARNPGKHRNSTNNSGKFQNNKQLRIVTHKVNSQ